MAGAVGEAGQARSACVPGRGGSLPEATGESPQGASPLPLCSEVKTSPAVMWNTARKVAKWKQDIASRDEGIWTKMEGRTRKGRRAQSQGRTRGGAEGCGRAEGKAQGEACADSCVRRGRCLPLRIT